MNKSSIIVTGASSGIGAGIARLFAHQGYFVALLARNLEAMSALNLPNALCIETNVTCINSLREAVKQVEAELGPVDCLINNAGFGKDGAFTELTHQDNLHMVELNVMGVLNTTSLILPGMQRRKRGTIINISSLADRKSRPYLATYAATKAAVRSLSDSLREANAPYGIRVCNLAPAKVKTPLLKQSCLDDGDVISVEDLAKAVLWIYEQPQAICIRDLVIAPTAYEA